MMKMNKIPDISDEKKNKWMALTEGSLVGLTLFLTAAGAYSITNELVSSAIGVILLINFYILLKIYILEHKVKRNEEEINDEH
jgi:hypothetical protein